MPPQATADGLENEAETEGKKQKKKKKKKKKKTKEPGDNAQENVSPKRTEKPIQFDLGVMLQTISVRVYYFLFQICYSPDKKGLISRGFAYTSCTCM